MIADKEMKRSHGLITNLIVGVIGALLGDFIAGMLELGANGLIISLLIATAGAVLLLFILGLCAVAPEAAPEIRGGGLRALAANLGSLRT